MKEKMLERYKFLDYNDITVIPHGFDAEDFPLKEPNPATITGKSQTLSPAESLRLLLEQHSQKKEKKSTSKQNVIDPSKKLIFTHCGLFPDSRTPKYFLKGMAQFLHKNPAARQHIRLVFVGIMRPQHVRLIKRYKLDDLTTLTGYLPHSEAVQHLQKSDVN